MASDLPVMVPRSRAEIRRLFFRLVNNQSLSFAYHLAWSCWRRAHQALARLCQDIRRYALASHLQLIYSWVERRDHLSEMGSARLVQATGEPSLQRAASLWRESERLRKPAPRPSGSEATIGLVAAPGHIQEDCRSRMSSRWS